MIDIKKVAIEIADLVEKKNKDYGNSFDRSIEKYGYMAYFLRIDDKMSRLNNLLNNRISPNVSESVEDTLKDIIGYTLLMINNHAEKGE